MKFSLIFSIAFCMTATAFAQSEVELKGKLTQIIPVTAPKHASRQLLKQVQPKTVSLMDVKLSNNAWHILDKRVESTMLSPDTIEQASTDGTQLGMNKLPALDQGPHSTCATFAVTAALDAALEKGDYISQLCNLQLGQELEQFGYNPSGWDGSLNGLILNQIAAFGLVTKNTQKTIGCGANLTEYPRTDETPTPSLSLSEYHAISEPLPEDEIAWSTILDIYQAFLDRADAKKTLESVKQSLKNKDRLTFGVLLFGLNEGVAGATGKYHVSNDTWLLTSSIIDSIKNKENYGGHAMIITGFNDFATAVDADGYRHKGLLTIRNSWGPNAGDHGDFYMSYDYFKLLTIEIQRIRSLKYLTS